MNLGLLFSPLRNDTKNEKWSSFWIWMGKESKALCVGCSLSLLFRNAMPHTHHIKRMTLDFLADVLGTLKKGPQKDLQTSSLMGSILDGVLVKRNFQPSHSLFICCTLFSPEKKTLFFFSAQNKGEKKVKGQWMQSDFYFLHKIGFVVVVLVFCAFPRAAPAWYCKYLIRMWPPFSPCI